jgi:hypothetical protein
MTRRKLLNQSGSMPALTGATPALRAQHIATPAGVPYTSVRRVEADGLSSIAMCFTFLTMAVRQASEWLWLTQSASPP